MDVFEASGELAEGDIEGLMCLDLVVKCGYKKILERLLCGKMRNGSWQEDKKLEFSASLCSPFMQMYPHHLSCLILRNSPLPLGQLSTATLLKVLIQEMRLLCVRGKSIVAYENENRVGKAKEEVHLRLKV